jgi:hypothetical protein
MITPWNLLGSTFPNFAQNIRGITATSSLGHGLACGKHRRRQHSGTLEHCIPKRYGQSITLSPGKAWNLISLDMSNWPQDCLLGSDILGSQECR